MNFPNQNNGKKKHPSLNVRLTYFYLDVKQDLYHVSDIICYYTTAKWGSS